ncbi:MAG: hypothetical protein WAT79_04405 [Saprospiraceae bacterium]
MEYISFIDILGTKNSSESENHQKYIDIVINFQSSLIECSSILKNDGRLHFFSDCAFIETESIFIMIKFLKKLREELLLNKLFIRGSVVKGQLYAINGEESTEFIKNNYGSEILSRFMTLQPIIKKNDTVINGTFFFSPHISKAAKIESEIKAASIYIDDQVFEDQDVKDILKNEVVTSGYLSNTSFTRITAFYDIAYNQNDITESFLRVLLQQYLIANTSHFSYGRYYLSILITCINSSDFSKIKYSSTSNDFENTTPLFDVVIGLRIKNKQLYNNIKGLEFVYFSLLNKVYIDQDSINETTINVLKQVFLNKRFMGKYMNKISLIPKDVLSSTSKSRLIADFYKIMNQE